MAAHEYLSTGYGSYAHDASKTGDPFEWLALAGFLARYAGQSVADAIQAVAAPGPAITIPAWCSASYIPQGDVVVRHGGVEGTLGHDVLALQEGAVAVQPCPAMGPGELRSLSSTN